MVDVTRGTPPLLRLNGTKAATVPATVTTSAAIELRLADGRRAVLEVDRGAAAAVDLEGAAVTLYADGIDGDLPVTAESSALRDLRDVLAAGSKPGVRFLMQAQHRREWPALWAVLDRLIGRDG